ncbi:HIT family protein [Rhizobium sp. BR 314]|uniref:HIT family protein n=1 Tax=Rhizobium sp. BR 314 TaxID=3040013 RepID=UPI0039BFE75F
MPGLIVSAMATVYRIPEQFQIAETDGWSVNHRINSALPGYLMISSTTFTNDLSELSLQSLSELGPLLAKLQRLLKSTLGSERVYIGRYGHTPGYPIHFHLIPIYGWVEDLFWSDARYRLLDNFAVGPGETATDGAEMTLFVWREFCERPDPPPIVGPSVADVIALLREKMSAGG